MKKNKRNIIIVLFSMTIFGPILEDLAVAIGMQFVSPFFGVWDECFSLGLFAYCLLKRKLKFEALYVLLMLFVTLGFLSGYLCHVPYKIQMLGCFSNIKAVLVFLCLKEIDFDEKDLKLCMKIICSVFWLVFIADVLDFLFPSFKSFIGLERRIGGTRDGLRGVSGIVRNTHLTMLSVFMYFVFTYYKKKSAFFRWASALMVFGTVKVKDIIGFLLPLLICKLKKITVVKMIFLIILSAIMFLGYSILLPDHYAHYFGEEELTERQARPVLYATSFKIARDYFPLGVGFGRYGSPTSQQFPSPIYHEYRVDWVYGLNYDKNSRFMADTFWPMILGENGILGIVVYIMMLFIAFGRYIRLYLKNPKDLTVLLPSVIFLFSLISSFAKPTFSGPPNSFFVWGVAGLFFHTAFRMKKYEIK